MTLHIHAMLQLEMPASSAGLEWSALQMLVTLVVVCGLVLVITRKILPKMTAMRMNNAGIRVLAITSLEPRKRLYVIEIKGRVLLLGVSDSEMRLLTELDSASLDEPEPMTHPQSGRRPLIEIVSHAFTGSLGLKSRLRR